MFVSDGLGVNESGHLTVGGCDTVSLAKKLRDTVYVL